MIPGSDTKRKVVLGLGNILNRDEGLGIQALRLLEPRSGDFPEFEFLDGGVLGLNLLMIVEDCSHLLLLDSVDAKKSAGTVIELAKEQIPLYSGIKMSQHQVTFQEVLGLASIRGNLPENLYLIGIQPEDLTVGLGLSTAVDNALPQVVEKAIAVLNRWK